MLPSRILALALTFLSFLATSALAEMDLHFIDVGQGGGVLIQKGGKNILYDCGDTFAGTAVLDYLGTMDVPSIDAMIISHAHKDHMGGCLDVLNHITVKQVLHNGSKAKTAIWKKFLKTANTKVKDHVVVVEKDQKLDGVEGMELIVAYDADGWKGKEPDNSILVRITDDKVAALLTGDCEKKCEDEVVKASQVKATVLNVGHHGSNKSSSAAFLKTVNPKVAIISAGAGNQYGHPTSQVLSRLKQAKAAVYRTDHEGSIVIHSDGKLLQVETDK